MMRCVALASLAALLIDAGCAQPPAPIDPRVDALPIPSAAALAKIRAQPNPYNKGDAVKGRLAFGDCVECHSVIANGSQQKGPALSGVFGRRAASSVGFAYSEALRNSNIVWDVRHLDQWIFNPHETLPGTSMTYIGIRNDARRRDVLAYLIAISN